MSERPRSQGGGPVVSDGPVLRVMGQFGYDRSVVEEIAPVAQLLRNENFRVRADDRDWVVKRYRPSQATARIDLAHRFESRLSGSGVPAAGIQRTEDGRTLVEQDGGRYSLHAWIAGQQFAIAERERLLTDRPALVSEFATALGELHRVAQTVPRSGADPVGTDPDHLLRSPRYTARRLRRPRPLPVLLSRWQALRVKRDKSEFDRWVLSTAPEVASAAQRLARSSIADRAGATDVIVIHNDINWENLVFGEDLRLRALLDFDNVMYAPRVLEVGAAAVVLVGARKDRLRAFLSAYEQAAEVHLDREVVDTAMRLKCVQSILNSMRTYLDGNAHDLERLSSWCRHLHGALRELGADELGGP